MYKGLKYLNYSRVIELIHCSNRSFMGSQFIFSNSVIPIWALIFKFRQKRMHLFWSICNFELIICYSGWYIKLSMHNRNEVVSALQSSLQRSCDKSLFFLYKNLSLQLILLIFSRELYSFNQSINQSNQMYFPAIIIHVTQVY